MAKWGQGDPRWIVEERPDATNVNNWHWTERNATQWSKDKLSELLLDLVIEDNNVGFCKITEISKCEGEATASNRKGKLIFFYEWDLKLNWEGRVNGSEEEVKGKVNVLNLSEENSADEIDLEVTLKSDGKESERLKQFMISKGYAIIREKLATYIDGLHKEFSIGMILPQKGVEIQSSSRTTTKMDNKNLSVANNTSQLKELSVTGSKLETMKYTVKQSFKCRAYELYQVFTMKEMVEAFTRGEAVVEPEKGGQLKILGGNVSGTFEELIPDTKLVLNWRLKFWPAEHYSKVTLEFQEKEDCTELLLTQTGIPKNHIETTKSGWNKYYWESIKVTFGFGALLT